MVHNPPANRQSESLLDAALSYAARGWRVVPLNRPARTPHGIRCSCKRGYDCLPAQKGKHPRIKGWPALASTNPATIVGWWEHWPYANIGIVTGARSGLAVVDVDPRSGGEDSLSTLWKQHSAFPTTPTVLSGGRGWHYYFHTDVDLPSVDLADGINFLADTFHVVVAPPSVHQSRQRYLWELSSHPDDVPLAPLPDWIRAHASRAGSTPHPQDKSTCGVVGVLPDVLPLVDVEELHVSDRTKRLIKNGVPKGQRSDVIHGVILALIRAGYKDPTIAAILLRPDYKLSAKPLEQSHPRQWLAGDIARARLKEESSNGRA